MAETSTAFELVRTLGSLAGMVSAYIAVRREYREVTQTHRQQILNVGESGTPPVHPTSELLKALSLIPNDILGAANERITRARTRYVEAIRSPINPFELDNVKDRMGFEICYTLKLIKEHNGGKLPTKELEELWESFSCI